MKILVVEDDPVASLVIESALKSLGHETVRAPDGEAAWKLIGETPMRVVVSDWMMPKMDGLELCQRIREHPGDYTYFILLTNKSATADNRTLAIKSGVDDFLNKPVNPEELWMRLHVAERILEFTKKVQQLESFLPICSYCKKIRDDSNYWQQVESYVAHRTGTKFSHGVCPDCYDRVLVPQMKAAGVKNPPKAKRVE